MTLFLSQGARFLRFFNVSSKLSTLLTVAGLPSLAVASQSNLLPLDTSLVYGQVLVGLTAFLCLQSFVFSSKVLAHIMISSDEKYVVLSYFSLFGKRNVIICTPDNILPVADFHKGFMRKVTIKQSNFQKTLLFLPKSGGNDTEIEALEALFSSKKINE